MTMSLGYMTNPVGSLAGRTEMVARKDGGVDGIRPEVERSTPMSLFVSPAIWIGNPRNDMRFRNWWTQ